MSFIKKIVLFMKNLFIKKEKLEFLEEIKQDMIKDKENDFIKSIKVNINSESIYKNKIQIPICEGDGLGIQKKISY